MLKKEIKILLLLLLVIGFFNLSCFAQNLSQEPHSVKELKQLDAKISKRLNLTDEQKNTLKANRSKNLKEMEKTIEKMDTLHKKIRNVYILGIPKFQADLRTAPMKMELAMLKQKTDKIRYENRKNFESILTPEQKQEFEIMKKEFIESRKSAKSN